MCVHDILFILFIYQQINLMNKTIFNKRASLKFSHFSNKGYSFLTSTMGHPNQEFGKRGLINC